MTDSGDFPTPSHAAPEPESAAHEPERAARRPERAAQERKPTPAKRALLMLREVGLVVVGALVISILLRSFIAQMFLIPSGSMRSTLEVDDRVLVSKIGSFQRGDVVVFADPGGWLPGPAKERNAFVKALEFVGVLPNSSAEYLVKRVIGMPGDRIACCNDGGQITVNGYPLEENDYLFADGGVRVAPASVPFDVVVPAGRIFVMGDNRSSSADSRCRLTDTSADGPKGSIAFVPMSDVVGSTVAIIAPFDRWRTFTVPETFHHVPDPSRAPPEQAEILEASPGC